MTDEQRTLAQHMLDALESPSRELTKWEENFVASVAEQFAERDSLSDRQLEIVERIYANKTS